MDVSRIWKQELSQREAHLERKKNVSSALVLERLECCGSKSREDEVALQERFWGSFETDRFMVVFLIQINWILELICM